MTSVIAMAMITNTMTGVVLVEGWLLPRAGAFVERGAEVLALGRGLDIVR